MIGRLVNRVYGIGGFCFIGASSLDYVQGKHANALRKALLEMPPTKETHAVLRCRGRLGGLGELDKNLNNSQISFPGTIFLDDAIAGDRGHFHALSINGFLTHPHSMDKRDGERFRDDVVWNPPLPQPEPPERTLFQKLFTKKPPPPPPPQQSLRTFREANPKAEIDEQAMHVFWATGAKPEMTGSRAAIMAAFLLPASDVMDLMRAIEKDPNNFHKLLAALWPGYAFLHPLLNLGNVEIQRVVNPVASKSEELRLNFTNKRFAIQRKRYIPALDGLIKE